MKRINMRLFVTAAVAAVMVTGTGIAQAQTPNSPNAGWKPPIGSDNCCIEVRPEVRPVGVGPLIHTFFVAVHGVHLIENLKLDQLSAAGAGEFANATGIPLSARA